MVATIMIIAIVGVGIAMAKDLKEFMKDLL